MSDAKTPKKAETVSKNSEATKAEVAKTDVVKTETANSENNSTDNSATKSVSSPKSASQSSISHFSSVSTPQYRSSWNKIFGGANNVKKPVPDEETENNFPKNLKILDDEINVNLRNMLDDTFNDLAKKHGINSKGKKDLVRFQYSLCCEIKEK